MFAAKIGKLLLYIFAAWFLWVSWRAVPHFSEGLGAGLGYYRDEAAWLLDEFAAAGERLLFYARTRTDSMDFSDRVDAGGPYPGKFRTLKEPKD